MCDVYCRIAEHCWRCNPFLFRALEHAQLRLKYGHLLKHEVLKRFRVLPLGYTTVLCCSSSQVEKIFWMFSGSHRSSATTALNSLGRTLFPGHHTCIFLTRLHRHLRVTGRPRSTKLVDELQTNKRRNSRILRKSMWMGWSVSFYPGCPLIAF